MPVLAVALDAADRRLVESWAREGELPTLARLLEEGASARVASLADYFPEAVWPTLTTGCGPGKTGHYNFRCIPPGSYSQVFSPGRSHRHHFWHLLVERGRRVLLLDVPYAELRPDERIVQLNGWGQRGALHCESWPPELAARVIARHGRYPRWLDEDFDRSLRVDRRHLREALRMTDARTELLGWLLRESAWDLALIDYWETHSSSHAYYGYLDPHHPGYDERRVPALGNALLEIYRRVDRGLGKVLAMLPDDTDVLVFSPYGLRPSGVGREILRQLLTGLGYQVPRRAPPLGRLAQTARARLPWSVRRHVNARLSPEVQMRVLERMFADALDWSRTRAFPESEFGYGWIRVNLRGREPQGIVAPGQEYEALCDEIAGELRALTDASSGEPVVAEVARSRDIFDGPHVSELPDLLVSWKHDRPLHAARHPRLGVLEEDWRDVPTTEHTGDGFLIAQGPSIRAGARIQDAQLVDLAPTLLYLLDTPTPEEMDGRVLEGLIEPGLLASRPVAREPIDWEDERWPAAESAG